MKRKILFVDDEQNVLDGFRTMLHFKRKEWKCKYAINAEKGLKLINREPFDVVVADMRMPGMDGADMLSEVQRIQPGTIRIILSGYSDMKALLKSTKHAHQFLSKPCSSDTLVSAIQRGIDLGYILNDESVKAIVGKLAALPALPDLYAKISKELESAEPNLKRIGKLVEKDVGMTATLMKVANSSFFGFYQKITSPSHAVTLLGLEALRGLILGVHILKEIKEAPLPGYSVEKLWEHSLGTGYFAKSIAALEGKDKEFVDNCFIAGILHDVGKLIFLTRMTDTYEGLLEITRKEGGPISRVETREFGVSHAELGAYLLGLWGFEGTVVEGVYAHHMPEKNGEELTSALVVHVANSLQHELVLQGERHRFSQIDMEFLESANLADRLDVWREACMKNLE